MNVYTAHNAQEFEAWANSGEIGAVMLTHDSPCVWTGRLTHTLGLSACERLGLYVGRGQYQGGSIVNMPGDLSICITASGKSDLAKDITAASAAWLSGKGIEISTDGNDVLADGKKVVSWARAKTGATWQSVVHFSVGEMDLELVREICTKPMTKIPGALSEYGISADDCIAIATSVIQAE